MNCLRFFHSGETQFKIKKTGMRILKARIAVFLGDCVRIEADGCSGRPALF